MINSFDLLFSSYKSCIKYNNNELQKLMIKSILKHIMFMISIGFLVTCDTEDVLENVIGTNFLWLCQDSNIVFDDSDDCTSLCSAECVGYEVDEIPLSWTYYCQEIEEYYETMQECQIACPNSCIIETNS